ncbi:SLATT domain-containing protein [Adlercreutzia sp. ZJ141]|uniref:SLATT domain-containing protein n=1 Tax=Adlercreutzia sp. ZJ141 TaxID=2709406 RepID=UPI0013ED5618|nr:SLATT domain-containing protein [Adlercreutzia sp. ZJ141]
MVEAENKFNYLPGLIKNTRKSRIEAERRLLRLDALSKHASVYYACLTALLSLSSVFLDYKGLPFLSVASAVVVAICTVYASTQNYGVRAEQMKECYIELQKLLLKLDDKRTLEDGEAQEVANQVGECYVEIIRRTENHLLRDYLLATGSNNETKEQLRWFALRVCVYVVPVLVAFVFSWAVWSF